MAIVSIVTASYNYQDYIKETIESVLNQTFSDWEMIIVDDGSTDNSVKVIESYCKRDTRIKLYQHKNGVNKGLAETIKLGIKKTTTDWIIFLESDDTITPNYIEEKFKVIEQYPDIKFIFNDVHMFGDKRIIEAYNIYFNKIYKSFETINFPANIKNLFLKRNVVPTFSTVMLKKEILNGLNWESSIKAVLDYYIWSQLAVKYDFYYLDKKLTNWRMSPNSYINKSETSFLKSEFFNLQIYNTLEKKKIIIWYILFLLRSIKYIRRKIISIRLIGTTQKITILGKTIFEVKRDKNSQIKQIK